MHLHRHANAAFASAAVHVAFAVAALWFARDLPRPLVEAGMRPLTLVLARTDTSAAASDAVVSFTPPRVERRPAETATAEDTKVPARPPRAAPKDRPKPANVQPTRPAAGPRNDSAPLAPTNPVRSIDTDWSFSRNDAAATSQSRKDGTATREDYIALLHHRLKQAFEKPANLHRDLLAILELTIEPDGNLSHARLATPSGDADFDRAVLAAVARTRMPAPGPGEAGTVKVPFRSHEAGAR
ncbi:MAG TPA: TonB family protein [Opitutaceae bacterium]|nr:TonB family protein [Opitutaceae bacterium]